MTNSTAAFSRNRLTWLAYSMLAYIGFSQAILGPLMPFLRSDLGLNYTQGGFLPATSAAGLILTGLVGGWVALRVKRQGLFWGGSVILALSIVGLTISRTFGLVLLVVLLMGVGGSLTQAMIQAILSDEHGEQRSVALTEANVAASLSATVTPLILSSMQRAGLDWRSVSIIAVLFLGLLAAFFRTQPVPDSARVNNGQTTQSTSLPIAFWLYWLSLVFMVAMEMSISIWATDFFISVVGLNRTDAVLAYGAFPASMLLGRLAGSGLTRKWPARTLLAFALGLTLVGFPLFWLARVPALNLLGLVILGLGIANQYPLTLSMAVGVAPGMTNQASARVTLGVGTALLAAPLLLGWLADALSLKTAFGMVLVLMVIVIGIITVNNRFLLNKYVQKVS